MIRIKALCGKVVAYCCTHVDQDQGAPSDSPRSLTDNELKLLEEVDNGSNFSDYFPTNKFQNIHGGNMHFVYDDDKLWVVTDYECDEVLDPQTCLDLIQYTQGQWSDGIGEGFEQEPCYYLKNRGYDWEVFISPWYRGQVAELTQC